MIKDKRRMVICGATGINNAGDEAILEVLIGQYQEKYDITIISLDPHKALKYHNYTKFVSIHDKRACVKCIKKSDIFLLGGGGLFQDESSVFNVFRWEKICKLAIKYSKRIIIYANSIGPLNYYFSRIIVRNILNQIDVITLRDQSSVDLLKEIGVTVPIVLTADPAFSYNYDSVSVYPEEKLRLPEKYVAITIRHWYDSHPFLPAKISNLFMKNNDKADRYHKVMADIVDEINKKMGLPVVFISFLTDRDSKVAKKILSNREYKCKNIILNSEKNFLPISLMQVIKKSEFLVGMRLHSLIFAVGLRVPFVAIDYSKKVKGLLEELSLNSYSIPVDELSSEALMKKIELMEQNRDSILELMEEKHQYMKELDSKNKKIVDN